MANPVRFDCFTLDLMSGVHDLEGDTIKLYLTNTAPSVDGDSVKADLAEIAAGSGYTAGGEDVQMSVSSTGGVATATAVDVTITASGGAIAQFRYGVLYNDSATGDPLIAYVDRGAAIDLADGDSVTFNFGASVIEL